MKEIILAFLFMLLLNTNSNAQNSIDHGTIHNSWQQDFDLARKTSKIEKKHLLIYFTGSDWCGPCKMLDSDFFESSKFKGYEDKYFVLYKADSPRNSDLVTESQIRDNERLKKLYDVSTFPTIIVLDKNGRLIEKFKGYNLLRDTSYHFSFIESVIK